MPAFFDTRSRVELLLDVTQRIIVEDGVRALTLRRVAAESGYSAATLVHHFGGRERMDRVLGRQFAHRVADQVRALSYLRGLEAFLPDDLESQESWRTWFGWCEVGRSQPALAEAIAGARQEHRALIAELLTATASEVDLDLVHAVVEGLVLACTQAEDPLPPDRARAVLARLESLRSAS